MQNHSQEVHISVFYWLRLKKVVLLKLDSFSDAFWQLCGLNSAVTNGPFLILNDEFQVRKLLGQCNRDMSLVSSNLASVTGTPSYGMTDGTYIDDLGLSQSFPIKPLGQIAGTSRCVDQ